MTFFARPILSNQQFKQTSDSVLTLSGQTQIATISGLTLTDGVGGFVPIIATGGTNGEVLTFRNGKIVLDTTSVSGDSRYYEASPTTITVGGLTAGSNISGCTISCILKNILVPSVSLSTSICFAAGNTCREFGDNYTNCLCWNVVKNTNPIRDIYISNNGTGLYNTTLLNGGCINASTGGTISYSIANSSYYSPATGITCTSACYALCACSTTCEVSVTPTTIVWQNRMYYFGNCVLYTNSLISSVMCATPNRPLSMTRSLSVSQTLNNQFFYYALPVSLGVPTFTVNGLPNNAWGNPLTGSLFTITFVNVNGYSNQYYVARSDNRITGTYCIIAC
jgi:hypothetical protein